MESSSGERRRRSTETTVIEMYVLAGNGIAGAKDGVLDGNLAAQTARAPQFPYPVIASETAAAISGPEAEFGCDGLAACDGFTTACVEWCRVGSAADVTVTCSENRAGYPAGTLVDSCECTPSSAQATCLRQDHVEAESTPPPSPSPTQPDVTTTTSASPGPSSSSATPPQTTSAQTGVPSTTEEAADGANSAGGAASTGAIVGGTIGGIVALVVVFMVYRRAARMSGLPTSSTARPATANPMYAGQQRPPSAVSGIGDSLEEVSRPLNIVRGSAAVLTLPPAADNDKITHETNF